MQDRYDLVIGLEVHAQLSTESKLFCGDSTAFGADPNTQISEVSLGYPGTLPVLNKKALEFAISMGLACGCKISQHTFFDRKNYFYPDLPKGYQTTQDNAPICVGGFLKIRPKSQINRTVRLNRIHLEEDAGKSIHEDGGKDTLVDLNRAGVPLIEIVTEPDMFSSEEAYAFLYEIRKLVRYLGICDGNMEEGSLRCDANISVKPKGSTVLGSKVEIKNMNSLRFVQKAIEFEWLRQTQMLENGKIIFSETRQFNPQNGETSSLRSKETLNDYRYFPDPDLSPVLVSDEWLKEIRKSLPTLPETYYEKFTSKLGLPEQDAIFLTENRETAVFFDRLSGKTQHSKALSNWLMGPVQSYLNESGQSLDELPLKDEALVEMLELVESGKLNFSSATQILFPAMILEKNVNPMDLAIRLNILQNSSETDLIEVVEKVLASLPDKVVEYKKGKKGLIGLFMGEIKRETGGKADPKLTVQLLEKALR